MMQDLIGLPYRRGAQGDGAVDCWGLVRLACGRLHGVTPPLLPETDPALAVVARAAAAQGWRPVNGPAAHGDVLVMRTARRELHTGVVLRVRHQLQLLHADVGGSVLQPLADLPLLGFHHLRAWRLERRA